VVGANTTVTPLPYSNEMSCGSPSMSGGIQSDRVYGMAVVTARVSVALNEPPRACRDGLVGPQRANHRALCAPDQLARSTGPSSAAVGAGAGPGTSRPQRGIECSAPG
jgi:hypothetical protein